MGGEPGKSGASIDSFDETDGTLFSKPLVTIWGNLYSTAPQGIKIVDRDLPVNQGTSAYALTSYKTINAGDFPNQAAYVAAREKFLIPLMK